jgi:hypothetical protein
MKESLYKFLQECNRVKLYEPEILGIIPVVAEKGFLTLFHRWNESNGIVFHIVELSDSRYVVYE